VRRGATAILAALFLASGCGFLAVKLAPKKTARRSDTQLAVKARSFFRESLVAGRYEDLPEATRLLTAAYLENPRDPSVAFLLGMSHLWRVAERFRQARQDPTITDQLILADKYLSEARRLDPKDFRIPGLEGSVKMALGSIHQDEALKREGYFILKEGMRRYPEFNLFTMSRRPSARSFLRSTPSRSRRFSCSPRSPASRATRRNLSAVSSQLSASAENAFD
jgi:hypothetical protein